MQLDKIGSMGRRRFLNGLAALGVSKTALDVISQEDLLELTENPDDEVPYVERMRHTNHEDVVENGAAPEREPIYATIPREKWIRIEAAHDAAANIQSQLDRMSDSSLVSAGVTTLNAKSRSPEKAVVVEYITRKFDTYDPERGEYVTQKRTPDVSFERVENELPSQVSGTAGNESNPPSSWTRDGIPVVVKRAERANRASCKTYYYDDSYDTIPGGCVFENGGDQIGEEPKGTFGTPANEDSKSRRVIVTAGHMLDNEKCFQPNNNDYTNDATRVARVVDTNGSGDDDNEDFGYARRPDGNDELNQFRYRLASDSGGYKDNAYIQGRLNWSTVKYHEGDTSYDIKVQGARSGTQTGYIESTFDSPDVLKTSTAGDDGDSGGPIYKQFSSGEVYIAGIHAWGPAQSGCPDDGVYGNAMEYIEDYYGLTV